MSPQSKQSNNITDKGEDSTKMVQQESLKDPERASKGNGIGGKSGKGTKKVDLEAGDFLDGDDDDTMVDSSDMLSEELKVLGEDDSKVMQAQQSDGIVLIIKANMAILLVAIVLLILGLAGFFDGSIPGDTVDGKEPNLSGSPTLGQIKERGTLRCVGNWAANAPISRFDDALCEVIAAAASVKVEFVNSAKEHLFSDLQQGKLDLITSATHRTMEREVFETSQQTKSGFSFSMPYLYGGLRVGGDPFFVDCAEDNFRNWNECSDLKVCVDATNADDMDVLAHHLPQSHIVPYDTEDLRHDILGRDCNVIVMSGFDSVEQLLLEYAVSKGHEDVKIGTRYFSKHPISIVTRSKDPVFSDFVNTVLQVLLAAEKRGITQEVADLFPYTELFGPEYRKMSTHALERLGNFQELFHHTMPMFSPRAGLNKINDGTTGLLYTPPLGDIEKERGAEVPLGPILQGVLDRGQLRCGVRPSRPGFCTTQVESTPDDTLASFSGMDVDYCRALAASLFQGDANAVAFVKLDGPAEGYQLLASSEIDVMAGAEWNLRDDVKEPTTNVGYAFTSPYFYAKVRRVGRQDNYCLVTRQEDHDWASFVSWAVSAMVHAESKGISQQTSGQMNEVFAFGEGFHRMFRDAVQAIGNYAEVYDRNMANIMPREGRNLLNANPETTAQHYILPGVLE
ncbi:extracellular solute-binding protein [Seminavis robusta]|uniref:Extracellular solute-binding protein n=1 Tax=Seminavis robusta TaxID=568900 RepID=A0A9N8DM03_9STRA|nr:extracellular solute-binding protein [Seminavis robusta]|eukprot:Sro232_g093770.1 extracellular solute-binding protein (680) ;mRNA; r:13167-15465